MNAGQIVCLVIYGWVAMLVIGIGISQIRSKHPVGFYTGENPPKDQEITDVKCWNLKHGRMWIIYGLGIIVSYGILWYLLSSNRRFLPCSINGWWSDLTITNNNRLSSLFSKMLS